MHPKFPPAARPNIQLLPILLFIALSPWAARAQDQTASELQGKVCDVSGKPVASATVTLKAEGQAQPLSTQTRADGTFIFQSLQSGNYSLHVAAAGFVTANLPAIPIPAENKSFEVVLKSQRMSASTPSAEAPQFYDQPQFTVSGVTDTSELGGHGSAPMMRTRELVEKDVRSLSADSATAPIPASDAYKLAVTYANSGDYARARDQLQSLPAEQQTAESHHLLANVDEKLGNSLDAVHEYQRAAELDPSETNTFDWGSELLLHHAAEPAIQVFAKGNRLFPNSTRMLIGLGAAEYAAGFSERAVQRLCQASDLRPDDPQPYLFLAKIQRTQDTIPLDVINRFQRFQHLRPGNAEANDLYAAALWKHNQPAPGQNVVAQIELLLKTAIHLDPKLAAAYLQLGILHTYQHNSAAAIADFRHAIASQPDLEEAHYRLAQAYRVSGKMDDARAEIAIYQRLRQQSQQQTEREHHEIKQFVYSLRDQPPAQPR